MAITLAAASGDTTTLEEAGAGEEEDDDFEGAGDSLRFPSFPGVQIQSAYKFSSARMAIS